MGRENKKEAVAALHREWIMTAAERLFSEKGYEQTTIEDISAASGYSRRRIDFATIEAVSITTMAGMPRAMSTATTTGMTTMSAAE